jgi:hypothetical protein
MNRKKISFFFFLGFYLFTLLCGIVYMLFIVYYMQREIRSLFHRRMQYFRDFWTYPELGIIVCSWTAFAAYIWRITEGNRVSKLFAETNGYAYVNLQMASYVNNVLTDLLAFCCFFATIKFLRLLRFNHRMSLLSSTLSYAARDLISFTFMFSILYCGYLTLFYLVFQAKVYQCSDVLKTAQMLFEMMLLKFSISFLYNANPILGPICFTLFIIFIVFICMNMVCREEKKCQKKMKIFYFSLFRLLRIHFELFDVIFHYNRVNMKLLILRLINLRNGQVKRRILEYKKN